MREKYSYLLFGFNVESEIDLGLNEQKIKDVDISITLDGFINQEKNYRELMDIDVIDNGVKIHMYGIAEYEVTEGRFISVKPYGVDFNPKELALYITGTVFSFILFQKNKFAIHGSAININDEVIIITGNSGAGKSTLARGFIEKGCKILSDDVSVLDFDNQFYIIPSYPSQKLWEDSSNTFGIVTNDKQRIVNRYNKFHIQIDDYFEYDRKKLSSIVMIEESDCGNVSIEKLDQKNSLQLLLNNTYGNAFIEIVNMFFEQLEIMAKVASMVDVFIMKRPTGVYTVKEQIELVEQFVNKS